jgi:hypothetical protein
VLDSAAAAANTEVMVCLNAVWAHSRHPNNQWINTCRHPTCLQAPKGQGMQTQHSTHGANEAANMHGAYSTNQVLLAQLLICRRVCLPSYLLMQCGHPHPPARPRHPARPHRPAHPHHPPRPTRRRHLPLGLPMLTAPGRWERTSCSLCSKQVGLLRGAKFECSVVVQF